MFMTIVLRKEVLNETQAQQLFDIVKTKLADHPEINISGNVSTSLPLTAEVPE